jgi:hypothetical protein
MKYLVTTDKAALPTTPICMVDGTVPGWSAKDEDLHFDHHVGANGAKIQLLDIPGGVQVSDDVTFVTTQVDADACAAAAWIQLLQMKLDAGSQYQAFVHLSAIAYDCDHLGLPAGGEWDPYRDFAKKAVAALKESSGAYIAELGLSKDRKTWSESDKTAFASLAFERGTKWLIAAALGDCNWPGELGEADAYFERMEQQRPRVYEKCFLYRGVAVFDQSSFEGYVDPRILVEWARESGGSNVTLTMRDGSHLPNAQATLAEYAENRQFDGLDLWSYTLGSVPLHETGSPQFSKSDVWTALAGLEVEVRKGFGLNPPATTWGGRDEVGGSGWRDPAVAVYGQVLDRVLAILGGHNA